MLDRLYGFVALSRRRWIERHPESRRSLAQPVISIGNLTVGGTGKTPVVAAVASWLVERGERPAILSRGYGRVRPSEGVTVVSDGVRVRVGVDEAGDEPLMLARQVPGAAVCVDADRYLAGTLAERSLGCTVHVLDDGFQHYRLNRDLDVLVSGPEELAGGRVLPAGRLREPLEAAARAHFLIVVGADAGQAAVEAWPLGISESAGATRVLGAPELVPGTNSPGPELVPGTNSVVAVAGIAKPGQFFNGIRQQGWAIAREMPFPDHHVFTAADVAAITDAVRTTGAACVLTTEKDAVRFEVCRPLPFALASVPMRLTFDRWTTVEGVLDAALERGRTRAGALTHGAGTEA